MRAVDRIKFLSDTAALNAYLTTKQSARAIALIRKEMLVSPASIELRSALINLYIKLKDIPSAIKELNALAKVTYQVGNPYEMAADAEPAGLDSRNLCEHVISGWKVCGGRRQESL